MSHVPHAAPRRTVPHDPGQRPRPAGALFPFVGYLSPLAGGSPDEHRPKQ